MHVSKILTILLGAILVSAATARAQDPERDKVLERCLAIQDRDAKLQCFESATSNLGESPRPPAGGNAGSMEAWRLVRSPPPTGGKAIVSIMHTADMLRSDPDLAGLMIRCGDAGNEVLIAVTKPLPFRARPHVVLGGGGRPLEGKILPPGALILLPPEAATLVEGPWRRLAEVSVEMTNEGEAMHGVVPIAGLTAGMQTLRANCLAN
jgi:hypothetical protein